VLVFAILFVFFLGKDFFLNNYGFRIRRARRTSQQPIPVILDLDAEETPKKGNFIRSLNFIVVCFLVFSCVVTNCFDEQKVGERRKKGLV